MDAQAKKALELLCKKAEDTTDGWVNSCDIGLRGDQRAQVCQTLESEGMITNCSVHGQTYVGCTVTQKGMDYWHSNKS